VKRTTIYGGFDPGRYGMIFCPDCGGSGKSFQGARAANVCRVCGGFGLIKKQEGSGFSGQDIGRDIPIELLK